MTYLRKESLEIVAHYRARKAEYSRLADALRIPRFSNDLLSHLSRVLGSTDNARLVEAVSRLGNYSDGADHADMRKAVSKLLRKDGEKLPRGKRAKPELEALVENLTPLLLFFGLRLASSERSPLVVVLRLIADEFDVSGDPRDMLRSRIKADRILQQEVRKKIIEAVRRGLSPLGN